MEENKKEKTNPHRVFVLGTVFDDAFIEKLSSLGAEVEVIDIKAFKNDRTFFPPLGLASHEKSKADFLSKLIDIDTDFLRKKIQEFSFEITEVLRHEDCIKDGSTEKVATLITDGLTRLLHDGYEKQRRGRQKVMQLLDGYENKKVCFWFDKVREKLKLFIESMKQLLVCFFYTLFQVAKLGDGYGKETCFYEMIRAHLQEKIPSKSMFQKAVKWFRGETGGWINKNAEKRQRSVWEKLCKKIKKWLQALEPQFAMA